MASAGKAKVKIGIQAGTTNTAYARWSWGKKNTDSFKYKWKYKTKNGKGTWFMGSDGTTSYKDCTYSIPDNAIAVAFTVLPIAKKNKKNKALWHASWSTTKTLSIGTYSPIAPSAPSVTLDNLSLKMEVDVSSSETEKIEFNIVQDDKKSLGTTSVKVILRHASFTKSVAEGHEYKVRCRGVKGKSKSAWSDFSSIAVTKPKAPAKITSIKALSSTSIYIEWSKVAIATGYKIEYTTNKDYFDSSPNGVGSVTVDKVVQHAEITGLSSGEHYYFRVCSTNNGGDSAWIYTDLILGRAPAAPTTWSSTTKAVVGEPLNLYWIHNSQDNSSQTYAQLELTETGVKDEKWVSETIEDTGNYSSNVETCGLTFAIDLKASEKVVEFSFNHFATFKDEITTDCMNGYIVPPGDGLDSCGNIWKKYPFQISKTAYPEIAHYLAEGSYPAPMSAPVTVKKSQYYTGSISQLYFNLAVIEVEDVKYATDANYDYVEITFGIYVSPLFFSNAIKNNGNFKTTNISAYTFLMHEVSTNSRIAYEPSKKLITIKNSTDEFEKDKTSVYPIKTDRYTEGATINWRVRTRGVTEEYGDWSIMRTANIYTKPSLALSMADCLTEDSELTQLPIKVNAVPSPNTQKPMNFLVTVSPTQTYETVDELGNDTLVGAGTEIYSKIIDSDFNRQASIKNYCNPDEVTIKDSGAEVYEYVFDAIVSEMDASLGITLSFDISMGLGLAMKATAVNDSGEELTVEGSRDGTILSFYIPSQNGKISKCSIFFDGLLLPTIEDMTDAQFQIERGKGRTSYEPWNPELIDPNILNMDISAKDISLENNIEYVLRCTVSMDSGLSATSEITFIVAWGDDEFDVECQLVYDEDDIAMDIYPYCSQVDAGEPDPTIQALLSVYRREYDGTFVEIESGLENSSNTFVRDPHPALDYGRYRIVAISEATGNVIYRDIPGEPIGETAIIIQWNETVTDKLEFDGTDGVEDAIPQSGTMLRLPYNIDISDGQKKDISTVKYIGRRYPVSYYGTSIDTNPTWNVEIPATDTDTLYALRRLAIYMGDVYVREPSGAGYWATVEVSYSQKHRELTIPVTLSITRVEGGK